MKQTTEQGSIRQPWTSYAETELDWGWNSGWEGQSCPDETRAACGAQPRGLLSGAVIDRHGCPVRDFTVVVHWRPWQGCTQSAGSHMLATDQSGRYSVDVPCCGLAYVSFEEDAAYYRMQDFEPHDGEAYGSWFEPVCCSDDVEWPTAAVSHAGVVSGRVTDESQQPIAGIRVGVYTEMPDSEFRLFSFYAETDTDAAGSFRLGGIKCVSGELAFIDPSRHHAVVVRTIGEAEDGADLSFGEGFILQDLEVCLPTSADTPD